MNRRPTDHRLAERLRKELQGEVLFDAFSRGRYSTDASHYQIEPVGVVVPRTDDDVRAAIAIAREEGVPLLPRGGATSQSGQTVGRALVVDFSKHLNRLISADPEALSARRSRAPLNSSEKLRFDDENISGLRPARRGSGTERRGDRCGQSASVGP